MSLREQYQTRYDNALKLLAENLREHIKDNLNHISRIDSITTRAKSVDRFVKKSYTQTGGEYKYTDALNQIQDQIGARLVTFYWDDVDAVSEEVEAYYRNIEAQQIEPDSEYEFGYVGKHYILLLPEDIIGDDVERTQIPRFFELQIKTLFQHAWSEANHDLGYKPEGELNKEEKRKLAFTAAQAWGADRMFTELLRDRNS